MKQIQRNNNIGILHFVAALFVMYGHMCALMGIESPIILGNKIQALGVKIIFVISGYLITRSLYKIEGNKGEIIIKYGFKRLLRLYPEFIGCVLVTIFIIAPIFSYVSINEYFASTQALLRYARNLLLFPVYYLPGMFEYNPYPNAVNGSLWTMPVEVALYILIFLPAFFKQLKNKRIIIISIFTLIISINIARYIGFINISSMVFYGTDWIQALDVMPYFLVGSLTYYFKLDKIFNISASSIVVLFFAVIRVNTSLISEILYLIVIPWFILSIGFSENSKIQVPNFIKTELSYGLYLYGFIVQQCVIQFFYSKNMFVGSVNILFVISLFITYVIALISYYVFYKLSIYVVEKIKLCMVVKKNLKD